MAGFFVFLFLLSLILLPVGLIKPSLFQKFFINTRKKVLGVFGGCLVLFFVLIGITAPASNSAKPEVSQDTKGVSTQISPSITSVNPTVADVSKAPTPTATSTPIPTKTPTSVIINTTTPTAAYIAPTTSQDQSQGLSNDNYYENSAGNEVHSPAYSNTVPAGASAVCGDGTYSFSQSRRGTCSHHGVAQWL